MSFICVYEVVGEIAEQYTDKKNALQVIFVENMLEKLLLHI